MKTNAQRQQDALAEAECKSASIAQESGWTGQMRARLALSSLAFALAAACLPTANAQDAAALRGSYAALREGLAQNNFGRPLVLNSSQESGLFRGEVYAVVAQPFAVVSPALQTSHQWCDVLMLHLNVKTCRGQGSGAASTLNLAVGRKFDQPLGEAFQLDFSYRVVASRDDYLQVTLGAADGPLDTKDYRVGFEAVALDASTTFVHMTYSYVYGMTARLAMSAYLATIGRDKVGFSIVGRGTDGAPVYIADMRGAVERNTMRYFLAIEAYLGALALPVAQRPEKRLRDWFDAIERYPRQLHELTREEYLGMKRREMAQRKELAAKV